MSHMATLRAFTLCLFLLGAASRAEDALKSQVVDDARLFSDRNRQALIEKLKELQRDRNIWMVVWTPATLAGTSAKEAAGARFQAWGIEQKGEGRGLLLMIAPQEQQIRFEFSDSLKPLLTPPFIRHLEEADLVPSLQAGAPFEGVSRVIEKLKQAGPAILKSKRKRDSSEMEVESQAIPPSERALPLLLALVFSMVAWARSGVVMKDFERFVEVMDPGSRRANVRSLLSRQCLWIRFVGTGVPLFVFAAAVLASSIETLSLVGVTLLLGFAEVFLIPAILGAYIRTLREDWLRKLREIVQSPAEADRLNQLAHAIAVEQKPRGA